jgi:hypothetical protein
MSGQLQPAAPLTWERAVEGANERLAALERLSSDCKQNIDGPAARAGERMANLKRDRANTVDMIRDGLDRCSLDVGELIPWKQKQVAMHAKCEAEIDGCGEAIWRQAADTLRAEFRRTKEEIIARLGQIPDMQAGTERLVALRRQTETLLGQLCLSPPSG